MKLEDENERIQNDKIESVSKESRRAFWLAVIGIVASFIWPTIEGAIFLRDRRARDLVIDAVKLTSPESIDVSVINRLGKTIVIHRVDLEFVAEGTAVGTQTSQPFVSTDAVFVNIDRVNESKVSMVDMLYELKDQDTQVLRLKFLLSSSLVNFKGKYCLTNVTLVTGDGAYRIDQSKFPDGGKLVLMKE